ncbi:MAG: hypothetical protein GY810_09495 [Aureispira sp.]|nr:hypothetical protein [Aureispira sp.]
MAKKKKEEPTPVVEAPIVQESGIENIREILMGDYIREATSKFQALDQQLGEEAGSLGQRLDDLEKDFNEKLGDLETRLSARVTELEEKLDAQVAELESQIVKSNKNQKQKLSKLFGILSAQITGED